VKVSAVVAVQLDFLGDVLVVVVDQVLLDQRRLAVVVVVDGVEVEAAIGGDRLQFQVVVQLYWTRIEPLIWSRSWVGSTSE
jgi:hypothetical protein